MLWKDRGLLEDRNHVLLTSVPPETSSVPDIKEALNKCFMSLCGWALPHSTDLVTLSKHIRLAEPWLTKHEGPVVVGRGASRARCAEPAWAEPPASPHRHPVGPAGACSILPPACPPCCLSFLSLLLVSCPLHQLATILGQLKVKRLRREYRKTFRNEGQARRVSRETGDGGIPGLPKPHLFLSFPAQLAASVYSSFTCPPPTV